MAARRCSTCGKNWPLHRHACPDCGGPLWHLNEGEPDDTEDARADEEVDAGVFDSNGKVVEYRVSRFVAMGLSFDDAVKAAKLRDLESQGYAVDLHRFEDLRKAGASAVQALEILRP